VVVLGVVVIDWVSFIQPTANLNVTAWNPLPALAIFLFVKRSSFVFSYAAGLSLADWLIRGSDPSGAQSITLTLINAVCYFGACVAISRYAVGFQSFNNFKILILGLMALLASVILNACLTVATLLHFDAVTMDSWIDVFTKLTVGDLVGLLVLMPLLSALTSPARWSACRRLLRQVNFIGPVVVIVLMIGTLASFAITIPLRYSYFILLPLAWIAVRHGLSGVILASFPAQLLLVTAYMARNSPNSVVLEVQTLMTVISLVALTIGVTIDEKVLTERRLRSRQRASTLGRIAGVVTHEISQPLTSISTYAMAAHQIIRNTPEWPYPELSRAVNSIVAESARVRKIIHRVKDFYQQGNLSVSKFDLAGLIRKTLESESLRALSLGVQIFELKCTDSVQFQGDATQLSLALRNLVTNGTSAAANGAAKWQRVELKVDATSCSLDFWDSGPFIEQDTVEEIFDFGYSRTSGGMGVGLHLARDVIEAHQGEILAIPNSSLKFRISFPITTSLQVNILEKY
jgi:two-component system sensor kinase FixL